MKRRYDSVRVGEMRHEEIGLSEKSGLQPLCVRETEGDFHCDEQVQSGLCKGLRLYSVDYRTAHELLYGKHGNIQRSCTLSELFCF